MLHTERDEHNFRWTIVYRKVLEDLTASGYERIKREMKIVSMGNTRKIKLS